MTDSRPMRLCMSCGQVDNHPRHVHGTASGDAPTDPKVAAQALANGGEENREVILSQIMDSSTVIKHLDCCAADGCPDGSCDTLVQQSEGAKGAKLREFLTSGAADSVGSDLNDRRSDAGDDSTEG